MLYEKVNYPDQREVKIGARQSAINFKKSNLRHNKIFVKNQNYRYNNSHVNHISSAIPADLQVVMQTPIKENNDNQIHKNIVTIKNNL